jgi:hypothetical protein
MYAKRARSPATWLALLAVLALALVPTISRALAHVQGDAGWAEVCTAQGMNLGMASAPADEAPAAKPGLPGHLEPCAFCALCAGAAPPPAGATPAFGWPHSAAGPPERFLQAPRTPFAWRSAQPRAPPIHS